VQAGFDTAFCNIHGNGATVHTGLTGGYVSGTSNQTNGGFSAKFDTYFAGLYGAFAKGLFSAEAEFRYDNHSLDLSDDDPNIIEPGTDTDGETFSGMLTASYDIPLSEVTKLVPALGVTVSNTSIDSFVANRTGVAQFDDLLSIMGYAGLTATTQVQLKNDVAIVPFASATVYNEFADDSDSSFTIGGTRSDITTERIGTFGQVGVGLTAVKVGNRAMNEPNIYGTARFDVQFGDHIDGWGVTGAVRVQF